MRMMARRIASGLLIIFVINVCSLKLTKLYSFCMEKGKSKNYITSQPRSINGQQYPCPAFIFFSDFRSVSRAAAPERQYPVEHRGYFVRPFIRPSICPSIHPFFCCLIVSAGLGAFARWPWPKCFSLEALIWGPRPVALALGPWPQGVGLRVLAWESCPRGPGLEARPCLGSLGLVALAWKPWPGGPCLESWRPAG